MASERDQAKQLDAVWSGGAVGGAQGLVIRTERVIGVVESGSHPATAEVLDAALSAVDAVAFVRSLARVVAGHGFEDLPAIAFAMVGDPAVRVFLHGSAYARFSGSGGPTMLEASLADTWIEQRLPVDTTALQLWTGHTGTQVEPLTNLIAGVVIGSTVAVQRTGARALDAVPSSGLTSIDVQPLALIEPAVIEPAVIEPAVIESAVVEPVVVEPAADPTPFVPPTSEPDPVAATPTSAAPAPSAAMKRTVLDLTGDDSIGPLTLSALAADLTPPVMRPVDGPDRPDHTVAIGAHRTARGSTSDSSGPRSPLNPGMVRGIPCPEGHLNRPTDAMCRTCGVIIEGELDLVMGPRPVIGWLVLDTGELIELDRPCVIGHGPPDDHTISGEIARAVALDDSNHHISRLHVEVQLSGWEVRAIDRGSTNGTRYRRAGSRRGSPLKPFEPQPLQPGDVIEIGLRTVTFEDGLR